MDDIKLTTIELLDQLEEIFLEGPRIFFSGSRFVNEQEAIDILDELRETLPSEIVKASKIINDKDKIIQYANNSSREIVNEAEKKRTKLLDSISIRKEAEYQISELQMKYKQKCNKLIKSANKKAEEIEINSQERQLLLEKRFKERVASLEKKSIEHKLRLDNEAILYSQQLKSDLENNYRKLTIEVENLKIESQTILKERQLQSDKIVKQTNNHRLKVQKECEETINKAKAEAIKLEQESNKYVEKTLNELEKKIKYINKEITSGKQLLKGIEISPQKINHRNNT